MISYTYVDGEYIFNNEVKKSKFITYVIGEAVKNTVENKIKEIRKSHSKATHCTYAYVVNEGKKCKCSDDGEPQGTAGKPILSAIQSSGIVNTLVCVVRYFGGIKLGANGLVTAYNNSAVQGLASATKATKYLCTKTKITLSYDNFEKVQNVIKEHGKFENIEYSEDINIDCYIKQNEYDEVVSKIKEITASKIKIVKNENTYISL